MDREMHPTSYRRRHGESAPGARHQRFARGLGLRSLFFGVVVGVLANSGCAVKIPEAELFPEVRTTNTRAAVGIVPLDDQRPEAQREGEKPSLWVFLLYNQRIGTYLTSDDHFPGGISASLSRGLADALDQGRFGPARILDTEPSRNVASARTHCSDPELQFVATGAIDGFYGTLRQQFYLGILPLPFISFIGFGNSKSDALGVVQIDIEIIECETGLAVYDRRIERQMRFPEETLSEAARLTLVDVFEQVRNETSRR